MKVATFNCNGNGQNPMKFNKGADYPQTRQLQETVEKNLATISKTVKDVVGDSLNFLPIDKEIIWLIRNWFKMKIGDFYANKEIAAWRLTSLLDLQTNGVIYPWGVTAKMKIADVDEFILKNVKPVPERYNLPPKIADTRCHFRELPRCLVQIFWDVTPPELRWMLTRKWRCTGTYCEKTADQLMNCCDEHDIVLVQEMTLDIIDMISGDMLSYTERHGCYFYAIIHKRLKTIRAGNFYGSDHCILHYAFQSRNVRVGCIHALSAQVRFDHKHRRL